MGCTPAGGSFLSAELCYCLRQHELIFQKRSSAGTCQGCCSHNYLARVCDFVHVIQPDPTLSVGLTWTGPMLDKSMHRGPLGFCICRAQGEKMWERGFSFSLPVLKLLAACRFKKKKKRGIFKILNYFSVCRWKWSHLQFISLVYLRNILTN